MSRPVVDLTTAGEDEEENIAGIQHRALRTIMEGKPPHVCF